MDILIKYWLPILCFLLLSVIPLVVSVAVRNKKKASKHNKFFLATMTIISVLAEMGLMAFVVTVGGSMELLLPLLLATLFVALI